MNAILALYEEDLRMVVEDLLAMPSHRPVVVDLFAGYPTAQLLEIAEPDRAVFLVATDSFRESEHTRRFRQGKLLARTLEGYPNAEEIILNGYAVAIATLSRYVRKECETRDLVWFETGGNMSIDESYAEVCGHFGLT